jgi:hypothetical protein
MFLGVLQPTIVVPPWPLSTAKVRAARELDKSTTV